MPEAPNADRRPCLILIHGATLNGCMWNPVRRALDPRWDVLAPDLPAHGSRRHRCEGSEHGASLLRHREFAALVNAFADEVFATPAAAPAGTRA